VHTSVLSDIKRLLTTHSLPEDLVMVRLSSKAKRLIFKQSVHKGVEIVIPHQANSYWVQEMTKERIPWIRDALQRVREIRNHLNPSQIEFKALGEVWSVNFERTDKIRNGLLVSGKHTLTVGIDPNDVFHVARKLQVWFQQRARTSLIPWIASLAEDRGLRFNKIYIKNQVTLWGSCSKKRNINLNRNLLFIPKHLAEYVLHHELTHLNHLNHSDRFWASFNRTLPNCQELRSELSSLNPNDMPLWASPGLDKV